MRRFSLDDEQEDKLQHAMDDHEKVCPLYTDSEVVSGLKNPSGAIGGTYTYEFTPTGLGECLVVRCNGCTWKINLTDYDSW